MSDIARNNKIGMITHWIVVIIMLLFLISLLATGKYSFLLTIISAFLGLFSVIGEVIFYKRNNETTMVKHFLGYGYAVFYTFVLFTSPINQTYLFVIPLLLIINIYNDTAYTIKINTGTVIESLLVTIIGAKTGKFGYNGIDNAIVQNIVMILIGVFSYWSAKMIHTNMLIKMNLVKEMANHTQEAVENIYQDMENLKSVSEEVSCAMENVSVGVDETTKAAMAQLAATEIINENVNIVSEATDSISKNLDITSTVISEGSGDVTELVKKVETCINVSQDTYSKLKILTNSMEKMSSIIKLIDDISFQIRILSLNANVEAARAGIQGRSFTVVADEVSKMAAKTQHATESIALLISETSGSLEDVEVVVEKLISNIMDEKKSVENAYEAFKKIGENNTVISKDISSLLINLNVLTDANTGITESIQKISDYSETALEHTKEAVKTERDSSSIIDTIYDKMQAIV